MEPPGATKFTSRAPTEAVKVAAVIPAYNEADNIWRVLEVLSQPACPVDEVIVVDDGSQDGTAEVAARYGARVVRHGCNRGKGDALLTGFRATGAEVLLTLDADLVGLRIHHVRRLLEPVLGGEADMSVGVFIQGRGPTDWALRLTPVLSGQRCFRRAAIRGLELLAGTGFGAEVVLSRLARRSGARIMHVQLVGLTQRMKEEKRGFWRGVRDRARMYVEILGRLWCREGPAGEEGMKRR